MVEALHEPVAIRCINNVYHRDKIFSGPSGVIIRYTHVKTFLFTMQPPLSKPSERYTECLDKLIHKSSPWNGATLICDCFVSHHLPPTNRMKSIHWIAGPVIDSAH